MTTVGDAGAGRPVLDVEQMRAQLGDDEELVADVIRLYLDDYPGRVAAIASAIQAGDSGRLRGAAHALKGSAGAISASRVVDAARALEAIGEAGDLGPADQRFATLVSEVEQLAAVLRALQKGQS
jgi:HPt (histidine-containing phosphotransfer) domain-containing protein